MDERSVGASYREDQSIKDKSNIAKQRPPTQQWVCVTTSVYLANYKNSGYCGLIHSLKFNEEILSANSAALILSALQLMGAKDEARLMEKQLFQFDSASVNLSL